MRARGRFWRSFIAPADSAAAGTFDPGEKDPPRCRKHQIPQENAAKMEAPPGRRGLYERRHLLLLVRWETAGRGPAATAAMLPFLLLFTCNFGSPEKEQDLRRKQTALSSRFILCCLDCNVIRGSSRPGSAPPGSGNEARLPALRVPRKGSGCNLRLCLSRAAAPGLPGVWSGPPLPAIVQLRK